MSVKEQIIKQLEFVPETVLVQIYELIQVLKFSAQVRKDAEKSEHHGEL